VSDDDFPTRSPTQTLTHPPAKTHEEALGVLPVGAPIGRYLVLNVVATGGMGLVYAAYDPELDRKVAIKVLRADIVSSERARLFRARAVREAQAMARLSHPNVVPVFDVGTVAAPGGDRLFLAMELIEGGTLKSWLRAEPRGWRSILDVFVGAARGLAAAHAAGLIHRDFKPDNVLMGSDGRPRVTDFGLARATDSGELPPLDEGDDFAGPESPSLSQPITVHGTIMGTPGYMSPEQHKAEPVDARSDQFSFCAALYEALYGERAFPGENPSAFLESMEKGRLRSPPASTQVPAWLRRVVLRGLAIAPADRWTSMDALITALSRDPRARRRRFLGVGAALGLIAASVGAIRMRSLREERLCRGAEQKLAGVWDASVKARVEAAFARSGKPYAARAFQEVARGLDAYATAWVAMYGDACEATRIRGVETEEVMGLRMACLDGERKQLAALGAELGRADAETVAESARAVGELDPVSLCGDVEALTTRVRPPADPRKRADVDQLRTELASARALLQAGRFQPAIAAAAPLEPRVKLVGFAPLTAELYEVLGKARHKASDYAGAETALKAALWAAEEGRVDELKVAAATRLAIVSVDLHGYGAAHDWLRYAEAALKRAGAPSAGKVNLLISDAMVNFRESRYADSEKSALAAVGAAEEAFGARHLTTAEAWRALGDTLKYEGRFDEALTALEKSRAIYESVLGGDHPDVGVILRKEADAWAMQHDGKRALELADRAEAIFVRALLPDHLWLAQIRTNRAEALGLLGRYAESIAAEKTALPVYEKVFGPESENVGVSLTNIGAAELKLGRLDEARRDLDRAVGIYEKTRTPDDADLGEPLLRLGQVELAKKRAAAALPHLERALVLRARDGDPCEMLAEIQGELARALDALHRDAGRATDLRARAKKACPTRTTTAAN
jgi:tetratricopeptide (TPR) repeat protein